MAPVHAENQKISDKMNNSDRQFFNFSINLKDFENVATSLLSKFTKFNPAQHVQKSIHEIRILALQSTPNIFKFTSWNSSLDYQFCLNIQSKIDFFTPVSAHNFIQIINFYDEFRNLDTKNLTKNILKSDIRIPTFQTAYVLQNVINFISNHKY